MEITKEKNIAFLKMAERHIERMRRGLRLHEDFLPTFSDLYSEEEKHLFNVALFILSQCEWTPGPEVDYRCVLRRRKH